MQESPGHNTFKRWAIRVLPISAMLLVWAVFCWPLILGKTRLFLSDLTFYAYPMKWFMMQQLDAGSFPFWIPHIGAGLPFFAEASNQVLYPFNLLFFIFKDIPLGLSWFMILHLLGAMVSFYVLLRVLALEKLCATGFAIIFGLSGYLLSMTFNVNYIAGGIWAPLGMAAFIAGLNRQSVRLIVLTALCLAMLVFAGDTIDALFLGVFNGIFCLLQKDKKTGWKSFMKSTGLYYLATILLGGLIAAVQILPTLHLASFSIRRGGLPYDEITLQSFPPQRLVEFIHPFFFGRKFPTPDFIGVFLYPRFFEPWATSIYIGTVPVLLALYAIYKKETFWTVVLVASLLISFGHYAPYFPLVLKLLPPLAVHRYPEKMIFWTTISLCVLGAKGWQLLLNLETAPFSRLVSLKPRRRVFILLSVLLVLTLIFLILPTQLWIETYALFHSEAWGTHQYDRGLHFNRLLTHWVFICFAAVIVIHLLHTKWKKNALVLLLLLSVGELAWTHRTMLPQIPTALSNTSGSNEQPRLITEIQNRVSPGEWFRINYDTHADTELTHNDPRLLERIMLATGGKEPGDTYQHYWPYWMLYQKERLLFNYGVTEGFHYLNSIFYPLRPLHYLKFKEVMLKFKPELYLQLTGSRFVISTLDPYNPIWDIAGIHEIYQNPQLNIRLLEVENPLPRVYLATEPLYNNDPENIYLILTNRFQDLRKQVEIITPKLLPSVESPAPSTHQPETIRFLIQKPDHYKIALVSPDPLSYLVFNESMLPGWTCLLDDQPVPLYMANHRMMATAIPQGTHIVEFTYTPPWFKAGLACSIVGLLACLFLLIFKKETLQKGTTS